MTGITKVVIGGEDPDCCRLLAVVLESRQEIAVVGIAEGWRELGGLVRNESPNVVLLDTDSSGDGTASVVKTARLKQLPSAFVGLVGDQEVNSGLLPHLDAVVMKSDPIDELLDTILIAGSPAERQAKTGGEEQMPSGQPAISHEVPSIGQGPNSDSIVSKPERASTITSADAVRPTPQPVIVPASEPGTKGTEPPAGRYSPVAAQPPIQPAVPAHVTPAVEEIFAAAAPLQPAASATLETWSPALPAQDSKQQPLDVFETKQTPVEARPQLSTAAATASQQGTGTSPAPSLDRPTVIPLASTTSVPSSPAAPAAFAHPAGPAAVSPAKPSEEATAVFRATGAAPVPPSQVAPPSVQPSPASITGTVATGADPTARDFLPPAGTTNLIVSPFGSFRSLGVFQQAMEGLEGVKSARLRRFHQGTLYLIVRYDGATALEERVKELAQFAPRVISSKPGLIELQVSSGNRDGMPASARE